MENANNKFNSFSFWHDEEMEYGLNKMINNNTIFAFDWLISPLPMGEYQSGISAFDNIYEMAGFLKYKVLYRTMLFQLPSKTFVGFSMSPIGFFIEGEDLIREYGKDPSNEELPDFEELLKLTDNMTEYEVESIKYAQELLKIISSAFEQDETKAAKTIKKFERRYNKLFSSKKRNWMFGIKVLKNKDQLRAFRDKNITEEDWVYENISNLLY